jgi:hypothetical protein
MSHYMNDEAEAEGRVAEISPAEDLALNDE